MEGEDGGGDTGKGVGGMVVSIVLEIRFCLVVWLLKSWTVQGQPGCHLHPL